MKKYGREIGIGLLQLSLFYGLPLLAGPTDAMGMVVLILLGTFALSALMGGLSSKRWKWLYPVATAVLFLPSVWLYYNKSALIHAVWYFVVALVGLGLGAVVRKFCK